MQLIKDLMQINTSVGVNLGFILFIALFVSLIFSVLGLVWVKLFPHCTTFLSMYNSNRLPINQNPCAMHHHVSDR